VEIVASDQPIIGLKMALRPPSGFCCAFLHVPLVCRLIIYIQPIDMPKSVDINFEATACRHLGPPANKENRDVYA